MQLKGTKVVLLDDQGFDEDQNDQHQPAGFRV